MEEISKTPLTELGEFGLIDRLMKDVKIKEKSTIKGTGDDAAVINNGIFHTLVTTDLLAEGVHFDITYTPLKHLGYKAVVVNLSDVAAMNAMPKQITVSIAVSSRYTVEALEELYKGIKLACDNYGVDFVGGDTTTSRSGLIISVTAIGQAMAEDIVYRNGAKENDLICVSGTLGAAYAGLLVLEREKKAFKESQGAQPDLESYDYILERQLKPEPRLDVIKALAHLKVKPSAMMDVSDGLASEIMHITRNSQTGAEIFEDKLPIDHQTGDVAKEMKLDPTTLAMNGGEDYELLFTVSQEDYEKIKDNPAFAIIGYIKEKNAGVNLIARDGSSNPIQAQGWDALNKK
ncbi:MAG: thiamine-phosphate kinase [Bacteroidales bacterium]|nr:thiamine-phosphate kinase [Bacteroidales bacterium]MCF8327712.1 thiamine-phosphate kinase [Bacteroidales bacterium]